MANEPRKHHYVPRSVLRNFTIDGEGRRLYVFDKQSGRSFPASVLDAGAERDFNRVQICGKNYNFESMFQEVDDRLARVVAKVLKEASVKELSVDYKQNLPLIIACQLLRTKLIRTTPVELSRQLSEWLRERGLPETETISEEDARRIALRMLLRIDEFATPIQGKDFVLLYSPEQRLWTSDNPVVFNNSFPYGQTGLKSPGVEIYYPISSNLCMAFYCPSIREILCEAIDPNHPRPNNRDPFMVSLYRALIDRVTLKISRSFAEYLNVLQISQSSRFLYSSDKDFGEAERAISERPDVANVKSRHVLGSSVVPPAPNLPEGTWLIVEKEHRHYALPITLADGESPFIDFRTTDKLKLAAIQQDCPLDCVTVYENGHGIRGMRGVILRTVDEDGDVYIRVEHDDPGLNAIIAGEK